MTWVQEILVKNLILQVSDPICFFIFFQKAIQEKDINLWEVEKSVLGTDNEKVPPAGK